jgi:hypothetical protein
MRFEDDEYSWAEIEKPRIKKTYGNFIFNILTIFSLLGTVIVITWVMQVFQNPQAAVNPFPPATLPAPLILPSATPTVKALPPTWTPTVVAEILPTLTPSPTAAIATPAAMEQPVDQITPTVDSGWRYPYEVKGEPEGVPVTLYPTNRGCDWMGVAGWVDTLDNRPATGATIQLGGYLDGKSVNMYSLAGTAVQYGPAGYEFTLSDHVIPSNGSLWVRLVDQANIPLSDKIVFNTYEDCERNLIIIVFEQVR